MYYIIMPNQYERRVVKPSAINVLLEGIRKAKAMQAPLTMIRNLEAELVEETVLAMLQTQKPNQN